MIKNKEEIFNKVSEAVSNNNSKSPYLALFLILLGIFALVACIVMFVAFKKNKKITKFIAAILIAGILSISVGVIMLCSKVTLSEAADKTFQSFNKEEKTKELEKPSKQPVYETA